MFIRAVAAALLAGALSEAAAEGLQAQCGSETGRGYAVAQGVVRQQDAGWYDDAMTGETVIRIDTDSGAVDVRFRDATGIWRTPADDGGAASFFGAQDGPPGSLMVTVIYPGTTIETLTIAAGSTANVGTLIHTVSRTTPQITNSRVMVARCVLSAF